MPKAQFLVGLGGSSLGAMSIGFASYRKLRRALGDAATRTSPYIDRSRLRDARTGEIHDYSGKEDVAWRAVLLPAGAPARFADAGVLWNAAEAAERRRDAQVASELILALPAEAEVSDADRIALACAFAEAQFVKKGLAVQVAIHAPKDKDRDDANWHAHLLITTRRLGPKALRPGAGGFDLLKARDLDPVVKRIGGQAQVVEATPWGELWRAHQNRYFAAQGYQTRVDPEGLVPQVHIGPRRTWHRKPEIVALNRACQAANREATHDVAQVLDKLTRNNATFTGRELDRLLARQLGGAVDEIEAVRAMVMASPELVVLDDPATPSGRYSTRSVRGEEQAALAAAYALSARRTGAARAASVQAATAGKGLRPDQQAAFDHATGAGHLKLIAGRAGTGKSYTLAAIRAAYEADGRRVIGLAPTHAVAKDMKADGFAQAATVHAALFGLKNGRMRWGPDSVVIVDEAAMLGTPVLAALLAAADQAGAKLVLTGDDRQLPSIERGGMFAELLARHVSAEITEVVRQKAGWQRQAARDLAAYRFDQAVDAFEQAGAIHWRDTQADALEALVAAWAEDRAAWRAAHPKGPDERCFVFAYTNADVDALNAKLRAVCRAQGGLKGPDLRFDVCYQAPDPGEAEELHRVAFAVGDRIQFTRTDKAAGLVNGDVATITHLDAATGTIRAVVGDGGGPGREVSWSVQAFNGFRHGYAGTIYKGQGKTFERTYLLHSRHWTAAPAYVALTRQRKAAAIFVSRATAADTRQLARQMARTEERSASLAWATAAGAAGGDVSARDLEAGKARVRRKYAQRQAQQKGAGGPGPLADAAAPVPPPAKTGGGTGAALDARDAARARKPRSVERLQARGLARDWSRRLAAFHTALAALDRHSPDYAQARDRLRAFGRQLHAQPEQAVLLHTTAPALSPEHQLILRRLLDSPDPEQTLAHYIADAERITQHTPPEPDTRTKARRLQKRSRHRAR